MPTLGTKASDILDMDLQSNTQQNIQLQIDAYKERECLEEEGIGDQLSELQQFTYKVFEHLKQLWTGIWIWQHTHAVTTTEVSPDLGEFTEIIDDVSVKMIPLRYCRGCRTFQTASHIHADKTVEADSLTSQRGH